MRVFTIIHDKDSVKLETNHTKFESMEQLMMIFTSHFLRNGKVEQIENIISLLDATLQNYKDGINFR